MSATWTSPSYIDPGQTFSTNCTPSVPAAALNFDGADDKVIVTNSGVNLANKFVHSGNVAETELHKYL